MFPYIRLRRTRKFGWLRDLVAENSLSVSDLILPVFVMKGEGVEEEIESLPGAKRYSIDKLEDIAKEAEEVGIRAITLFPCVDEELKTEDAEEAYNQENLICKAIRHLKNKTSKLGIICDVALDPYTTHGHDGILNESEIDNDETLEALQNQALCLAKAGADIVSPSDMMDGRVGAIREILEENQFTDIPIIPYAAKYASSLYGPFRNALGTNKTLGISNKKTYQMDFRNSREAIREIEQDLSEGADAIIVKPATMYLDIINNAYNIFKVPIFAYHVSGEYAMLKYAHNASVLDFDLALIENLTAIKRAGAKSIITYGALEAAKILKDQS